MKVLARWLLALIMVAIGVTHFTSPAGFEVIVPELLPHKRLLVYLSGVAEIAGGLGLLHPRTRRWAAFGLIALYLAVFPANINMAVNQLQLGSTTLPTWALWARLPLQLGFIWWAYQYTRKPKPAPVVTS